MSGDLADEPVSPRPSAARWMGVAWLLLAGGFLLVAPHGPLFVRDDFLAWCEPLRDVLRLGPARWALSLFGGVLLAAGLREVTHAVAGRLP